MLITVKVGSSRISKPIFDRFAASQSTIPIRFRAFLNAGIGPRGATIPATQLLVVCYDVGSENNESSQMNTGFSKFKILSVLLLIASTTFFHYFTVLTGHHYYIFYRELYFFPLVLAGFWFGLRGALLTSIAITLAYLPITIIYWDHFSTDDLTRVVEIVLFNTIAIIIGILKDRERERYHQLVMAESLAAMGRAVSAAAHDMKTPLIAIGGFTNLVISKLRKIDQGTGEAPEIITDVQEKLAIVIKETERLENMVKEMLDFARPLPLQKSKENLRQIIEESAAIVEASASTKQIRIVNQTGEDLPPASIDPDRFKQVLVNLLMNAIQASPPGEQVTITGFAKAANLAIDVTDCGCGIPLDKRAEIFDPFFTTKKEGTGLGLPIAKKIIDAHGGKLEIVDNQHTGLSFRITIPL